MPRAGGVCPTPGCPNLRPCDTHKPPSRKWAGSTRRAQLPPNWTSIRRRILQRDRHRCTQCGAPANQVDHITPGNDHSDANLRALCHDCHQAKTKVESAQARAAAQRTRNV